MCIRDSINAAAYDEKTLLWQTAIHITFLLSALAIAMIDRLMSGVPHKVRLGGAARDGAPRAAADQH